ncbi:MAG TPA: hypothetical protein VLE27_01210 [Thermoanaerobaculia bacterium]|nr:hypothetical protein [Thermoanaerobaculia bacterium]
MTSSRSALAVLAIVAYASSVSAQEPVRRQGPPEKPFSSAALDTGAAGVRIGSQVVERAVTLDQKNHRIRFRK